MAKKSLQSKFVLKNYQVFILFSLLILVLYGKSFNNDYNIDDNYVIENHRLAQQGVKAIPEIFTTRYHTQDDLYFGYRPLTIAVYAIEWDVFVNVIGVKPHDFPTVGHVFNVIYYILCCFLLFYTLRYLFNSAVWGGLFSLLAVLVFIVHPIHTEVVLSLKNREEIFSTGFALLSLLMSVKYFDTRKLRMLAVALLFLVMAFLAKESAVVFLLIIPLCIVFFRSNYKMVEFVTLPRKTKWLCVLFYFMMLYYVLAVEYFTIGGMFESNPFYMVHNLAWTKLLAMYYIFFVMYHFIFFDQQKWQYFKIRLRSPGQWIILVLIAFSYVFSSSILAFIAVLLMLHVAIRNVAKPMEPRPDIAVKKRPVKAIIIPLVMLAITAIAIISIYKLQDNALPQVNAPIHKWQNPAFDFSKENSELVAIGFYTLGYYAKLLVIPYPLRFYYGYKMIPDVSLSDPAVVLSIVFYAFLVFYVFWRFNRRSPAAIGILWFLIAIVPFANFVFPLAGILGERLLFAPSVGFSLVIAYIIMKVFKIDKKIKLTAKNYYIPASVTGLILIPFAVITINRNDDWKNRASLYKHDIAYLENSAKANNLYANYLISEVYSRMQVGADLLPVKPNINLAIKHYKRAIEIDTSYSNPYHNVGYLYLIVGQEYTLAKQYFEACIAIDTTIDEAVLNLGIANFYLREFDEAIVHLSQFLAQSSKMPDKAYYYLAKSHISMADSATGESYFLKLLETNKTTQVINDEIMNYFFIKKDYQNAIVAAENQIRFNAKNDKPYVDIGNFYLLSGDTLNAVLNWEKAFEIYNGNYNIAMTLMNYYNGAGQPEKADYFYKKASEYRMNNPK